MGHIAHQTMNRVLEMFRHARFLLPQRNWPNQQQLLKFNAEMERLSREIREMNNDHLVP